MTENKFLFCSNSLNMIGQPRFFEDCTSLLEYLEIISETSEVRNVIIVQKPRSVKLIFEHYLFHYSSCSGLPSGKVVVKKKQHSAFSKLAKHNFSLDIKGFVVTQVQCKSVCNSFFFDKFHIPRNTYFKRPPSHRSGMYRNMFLAGGFIQTFDSGTKSD